MAHRRHDGNDVGSKITRLQATLSSMTRGWNTTVEQHIPALTSSPTWCGSRSTAKSCCGATWVSGSDNRANDLFGVGGRILKVMLARTMSTCLSSALRMFGELSDATGEGEELMNPTPGVLPSEQGMLGEALLGEGGSSWRVLVT